MADKGVTLRELKERPVTDLNGVTAKKVEPLRKIGVTSVLDRSEERRVGKECRSRWSPYH